MIKTQSLGLEAVVSSTSLRTGTGNKIRVSGSRSRDRDNMPGNMAFQ
jgi:hypothetical protein